MKKRKMVWIDMEMTGLDPERETIIEIATLITDSDLNIVEEGPNLVIHQPPKVLKSMDEWNQSHHKKSGLLEEVKNSRISLGQAEEITLDFIKKHSEPHKSPLCGNSVYHDRRFLAKYMPSIHKYLHYRLVDVSTLKELINRWYDDERVSSMKKEGKHRALSDIKESIEELKYYRKKFFKMPRKKAKQDETKLVKKDELA